MFGGGGGENGRTWRAKTMKKTAARMFMPTTTAASFLVSIQTARLPQLSVTPWLWEVGKGEFGCQGIQDDSRCCHIQVHCCQNMTPLTVGQ